jgi:hypothetical protein
MLPHKYDLNFQPDSIAGRVAFQRVTLTTTLPLLYLDALATIWLTLLSREVGGS